MTYTEDIAINPSDLKYCVTNYDTARWIQVTGDNISGILELGRSSSRKKELMKELKIISEDL